MLPILTDTIMNNEMIRKQWKQFVTNDKNAKNSGYSSKLNKKEKYSTEIN